MAKKKIVTSNIQDNHTLVEYQRYFSHLLANGKLKRFSLNEKDQLDPNRQYWKITDEKGKTYYYELPKYIKPGSDKTAYSMNRVMHRRPARIALAIFAGAAVLSLTSAIITKNLKSNPIIPPDPVNPEGTFALMQNFEKWHNENPDGDASKAFSVPDLATLSVANALYDNTKYDPSTATYPRRKLLTIGEGKSATNAPLGIIVNVTIHNAFIYNGADALEESISYSKQFLGPQDGRRDFYTANDGHVNSNGGAVTDLDDGTIKWNSDFDRHYDSVEAYETAAGKIPDNPFLYIIDETTILSDSTVSKTSDGYVIALNLDPELSTSRYWYRMRYLSGHEADSFKSVKLTFITDNNLLLQKSEVNEEYFVELGLPTTGELATKFYYDNVPDIPAIDTPFDYSPYLPIR